MNEIKKYDFKPCWNGGSMKESDDGDYIKYEELEELEKQLYEAYQKINEMKCCGNCKHFKSYCNIHVKTDYCLHENQKDHVVNINIICDEWEIRV